MAKSKTFLHWLQSGVERLIDPERKDRVRKISNLIRQEISRKQRHFCLDSVFENRNVPPDEVNEAAQDVYRIYLERYWADQQVTEVENRTLSWLTKVLQIGAKFKKKIHEEFAENAVETILANVMSIGELSDEDGERFGHIADWLGVSRRELMQRYYKSHGEAFLRAVFIQAIRGGQGFEPGWRRFLVTAERLGISQSDALRLVSDQAKKFVEHVLIDAKTDGDITAEEVAYIESLLVELQLPVAFCDYVRSEVRQFQLEANIMRGNLPVLRGHCNVELRAGELVHYQGETTFSQVRMLKNGPDSRKYRGTVVITDDRLIFSSGEKAFSIGLRSVLSVEAEGNRVTLQAPAKATGTYVFHYQGKIAGQIFSVAVRKVNQTIVASGSKMPVRHIPRDVRQRVWQAYGGQCAECGDTNYLEYDHIIPVSRGGSNGESNVQLLCRRCNLKKSDTI